VSPGGLGKVVPLGEAVRRHVRPGQVIHAGNGWGFPTALLYELVRQFRGRDPGFTLVVAGAGATNVVPFLRGGLVERVVSCFAGDGYPHPGPNPAIQDMRAGFGAGARPGSWVHPRPVEFEDWSLLTFTLRLLAGAMGLPWLPTRSLAGTSLGDDAQATGLFKVIPDPFGEEGAGVGLVKALHPDISLAHAWAADPDGNAVFTLPLAGHVYGALAAREGVIVSVERVVDRAYVAAHSDLVRLPAHRVLAVVEAPYGAHPTGLHQQGLRSLADGDRGAGDGHPDYAEDGRRGYGEDREFILEAREACQNQGALDAWLERWILGLPDHAAYLAQLGPERLRTLEARLTGDGWPEGVPLPAEGPVTKSERLIALASGVITEEVRRTGHPSVLAGVGAAHLACWLAREELAAQGLSVDLMAEIGLAGHTPHPADPFVFSLRNVPTALLSSDILAVLGMLVPEGEGPAARRGCLGVLGAVQVDRLGNINSSGVPGLAWLVGSGGANDVASTAAAVVVVASQTRSRFVEKVPYVTSPGDRVTAIVSEWGVFRRVEPGGEFALAAYYEDPDEPGSEAGIRRARERCGWDLRVLPNPLPLPPPRPELVRRLRLFDPYGHFRS